MYRIESFLSARLFLVPQLVGNRIYFISNMNGRMSLYVMDHGGSVPEPLLPPDIALQNPHLMNGPSFVVFPKLDKILVMIDQNGDENYQPMFIPLSGGYPEPFRADVFAGSSVTAGGEDLAQNLVYFIVQSRKEALFTAYRANLETGELINISESMYGAYPTARTKNHDQFAIIEGYGPGDMVVYHKRDLKGDKALLYGKPISDREPGEYVAPTAVVPVHFIRNNQGLLISSILFDDKYSLGYMPLSDPANIVPVAIEGLAHSGIGELEDVEHLHGRIYQINYNIDGSTWLYEAELDEENLVMRMRHTLVGQGILSGGVLESVRYDEEHDRYVLSFSTAVSPTQIYTIEGPQRDQLLQHTRETILAIPADLLAPGEEVAYTSFDGLRISARLYMPA
ncbi:MAG: S9 family peptidase, partial [Anaerolineales bacterium]|nr:S9 family peptidase [Anaerolineales bacterium]